ncbi:M20/M25/M40 family metallo-hydrolase [Myceligenerans cantabricum]
MVTSLGEVAVTHSAALHVVKVGSASLAHPGVYDELAALCARGARVLLVVGGATGIARHYERIGRVMATRSLRDGQEIRYCPPEEMAHVVGAYEREILPVVEHELRERGLRVHAETGTKAVTARLNPPLSVVDEGRRKILRDHRAGRVSGIDAARLRTLLDGHQIVCLSPPVAGDDGAGPVNVDADVLAAEIAVALEAHHLRLVTGTPGILRDVDDPASTVPDLYHGEGLRYAGGRMRQKIRAAEIMLERGVADVAITGPHTLDTARATRLWPCRAPDDELELFSRAVAIPSVTRDEAELATYLLGWCRRRGLESSIDDAGNLVARKGRGPRHLMMLGHLDTVPHVWPVRWDGDECTGRASVDAKGSLINFLEVLAATDVPPGCAVTVVGAVEEEQTARGADHVRRTHAADAVVVGEPSGVAALTVGYFGLLKFSLRVEAPLGHTAGQEHATAADRLTAVLTELRAVLAACAGDALMATLGIDARNTGRAQVGEAVVDVRVPPGTDVVELAVALREPAERAGASFTVHRATPGVHTSRATDVVRSFARTFRSDGVTPRYLAKKGSSDMNTLALSWVGVPMVAYGPGAAALDHTPHEHVSGSEVLRARRILQHAVDDWLGTPTATASRGPGLRQRALADSR